MLERLVTKREGKANGVGSDKEPFFIKHVIHNSSTVIAIIIVLGASHQFQWSYIL